MVSVKEFEIANTLSEARVILNEIQSSIDYDAEFSVSVDPANTSKKVVLVSKVIKTTGDSSKAMMQIGSSVRKFQNVPPTESLLQGLRFGSIFLAVLDFLLIPFVYLTCYLLDTEMPVNKENNAKWLLSGIFLALTITSMAVPAVAVAVAFVTTSLSLALSLFLLGRTTYEYYTLHEAKKVNKKLIYSAEVEMKAIQENARKLNSALDKLDTEMDFISFCEQVGLIYENYQLQKRDLLNLKLTELDLNKKLKDANFRAVFDKGVGFSLSAVGLIGLIVSLYFPLAGLGILTAVSVLSLTYVAARLFLSGAQWIRGLLRTSGSEGPTNDDLIETNAKDNKLSTDFMLERFFGSKEKARASFKNTPPEGIDYSSTSTASIFQVEESPGAQDLACDLPDMNY